MKYYFFIKILSCITLFRKTHLFKLLCRVSLLIYAWLCLLKTVFSMVLQFVFVFLILFCRMVNIQKEILKMLEENAIERHTLRQMFKDTLEKLEQYA